MGQVTNIAWCDHTFNYAWGCTKVSPGCDNCYAEAWDKRVGGDHWGAGKPRRVFSEKHWAEPLKWDRAAAKAGVRRRVFCSSMADVFDPEAPDSERLKLWEVILRTPHLDWLLLTKRPQLAGRYLPWMQVSGPDDDRAPWPNVWVGTTVEDQERADLRIPALLKIPAVVRFLSIEPQLGPVDLCNVRIHGGLVGIDALRGLGPRNVVPRSRLPDGRIDWVIVGGESGHGARPFGVEWARIIRDQCAAAGVPFFMKQMGAHSIVNMGSVANVRVPFRDKAGADPDEWPDDLRVREFPRVP